MTSAKTEIPRATALPDGDVDLQLCELAGLDQRTCSPTASWQDFAACLQAIAATEQLGRIGGASPSESARYLLDAVWNQGVGMTDVDPQSETEE